MKNSFENVRDQLVSRYLSSDNPTANTKSTDINILLNRIRTNKKNESRKKLYFSAAASTGLILLTDRLGNLCRVQRSIRDRDMETNRRIT